MLFMNEMEIDEAVDRFADHPVLSRATRFLSQFCNEVNTHSDGWPYWSPACKSAAKLITLINDASEAQRRSYPTPPPVTEAQFLATLSPIRAFYTRRGNAAGMRFPTITEVTPEVPVTITTDPLWDRLFIGLYPAGVVYADRTKEKDGDYARCAFLPYDDLALKIEPDCAAELRPLIEHDASEMQAKRGQEYQVSSSGQTVLLGSALPKRLVDVRRSLGHDVDGEPIVVEQPPALPGYGYEDRAPQPLTPRIGMERVPDHMLPPTAEQPPAPVIEPTDQGDQIVIPGGERSAVQAAAARNAAGRGRMRSRRPQRDPGGLFEPDPYPVQQRLFD